MKVLSTLIALVSAALCAMGQTAGSVSGTVTGTDGNPISAVVMMLTVKAAAGSQANPGVFTATSASDGTFEIASVPKGDYNLCASDEGRRFLDTCAWSGPLEVTVAGGPSSKRVDVHMQDAAEVTIDIQDPTQQLAAKGNQPPSAGLLIGVPAPHMFLPAADGTDAPTIRTRKLYVPYDQDLEISVVTNDLQLTDAQGRALKEGGDKLRLRVIRGQQPPAISITVQGAAAGK